MDLAGFQARVDAVVHDHPVVVDNQYAVWNAFANHYWPALYFVDATGSIRHHHFGEGEYEESEMVLQMLLRDAGAEVEQGLVAIEPAGSELLPVQVDGDFIGTHGELVYRVHPRSLTVAT